MYHIIVDTNTSTVSNHACFWHVQVGGNQATLWKPIETLREHVNSTQKGPLSDPGPSCCEATVLPTDTRATPVRSNEDTVDVQSPQA